MNRFQLSRPSGRVLCNGLMALLLALEASGAARAADADVLPRLQVLEPYTVPLLEISGLARAHGKVDELELYAVGDATHDIARLRLSASGRKPSIEVRSPAAATAASQWEAAALDGCGNLFVLAEDSSRVTRFDAGLTRTLGGFDLDPSGVDGLSELWRKEGNSRGEGMVPMRDGHLLVLKEKRPSLLVEFGPGGETAMGWSAEALPAAADCFVPPPAGKLVALKAWKFSKPLRKLAEDASELAVGPDRRLYMLSQKSALLVRLEAILRPGENKVSAAAAWRLPKGFETAEGLVIDAGMHPWVGLDLKTTDRPNLFRLSPLPPP
jgi:hypothetical protein